MTREGSPRVVRRDEYRPPAYLVDRVDLEIELEPACTVVRSRLSFRRNPQGEGGPLVLLGEQQDLRRVRLDGVELGGERMEVSEGGLSVLSPPERGVLEVESTNNPEANSSLEGLYVSSEVFCTQCEAEGFRRITYFPDRPDVLARYRVRIVAERERCPVLLSNGNLVAHEYLPDGRHASTWEDPFPKPCYLFAMVAGNLASLDDAFVTRSGRRIQLRIYSTPQNLPKCRHAMESLKRAMKWDEDRFGLEYDLDTFMIFSADDFNFGAMENKGLNVFNSKLLLASPETATDGDYARIEAVIGHEYFHNWTGNRVTCRDWFQLSLKEGLTVFRDQEFSSDMGSRAVRRIESVQVLRTAQFAEDAGPMAHPVRPDEYAEINNFYTVTVYEKGAEVIRMQHTLLGEERFRKGIELYFARHDGQAVTCDDFVQAMQDASGVDLSQFRRWYSQAGTPVLEVRDEYDADARTYTLHVRQSCPPTPGQPVKEPFLIPLAVGLIGRDGREYPLVLDGGASASVEASASVAMRANADATRVGSLQLATADTHTRVLQVCEPEHAFRFAGIPSRPVPSLLRGFSAPVKVLFAYTDEDLLQLASHDSDPVCRWDAAQRLLTGAIDRVAAAWRSGSTLVLDPALVAMGEALLDDDSTDPALRAAALAVPDLAFLVEQQPAIDLDALIVARNFVERSLASALRERLVATCAATRIDEPYAPVPAQVAKRSLRRLCLRLIGSIGDADARAMLAGEFRSATNMTDTVAALVALNDSDAPERDVAFDAFAERWSGEPLVLDKWFSLEATTQRADALERVRARMRHPAFDARNPNRVRSLIGAFAAANWRHFHATTGDGYRFVADEVLSLDRSNPMVASRIVSAFNRWRRFDPVRSALQRAELERIADAGGVSNDVREIVGKALAVP